MKQVYLKQKIFTLVDRYSLFDEFQNELYTVEGKFFSIPKRHEIYDAKTSTLLYTLRRVFFSFLPTFDLFDAQGNRIAHIRKRFTFLHHRIDIESSTGEYTIDGDLFGHDFILYKDGKTVAECHKKWLSWGDTYQITVHEEEHLSLYVALILAIDQAIHENKGSSSSSHH